MNKVHFLFLKQLAVLLKAGVPIHSALSILNEQKNRYKGINIDQIKRDIESGLSFSASLSGVKGFGGLAQAISIAEEIGNTEAALFKAAEQLEHKLKLKNNIAKSLAYPAIVLGLSVICLILLLVFVLPMFAQMFANNSVKLPAATRLLLLLADNSFYFIPVILIVALLLAKALNNIDIRLKIPVIGRMILELHLADICHNIGSQLEAGVPAVKSISLAHDAEPSGRIRSALAGIIRSVKEGRSFSESMAESGIFPEHVIQMMLVGERSGNLAGMMNSAGEMLASQAEESIAKLALLIEPAATLTVGMAVGFVALSVMMPLFSMMNSLL